MTPPVCASCTRLRRDVRIMQVSLEAKNKQLDALHMVWCNGGCRGGVNRFDAHADDVTEELVALAERNAKRLREWLENKKYRAARAVAGRPVNPAPVEPKEADKP